MHKKPPDKACRICGDNMHAMMSAGGYAPEGFEPEYDHHWCEECLEAFEIIELEK